MCFSYILRPHSPDLPRYSPGTVVTISAKSLVILKWLSVVNINHHVHTRLLQLRRITQWCFIKGHLLKCSPCFAYVIVILHIILLGFSFYITFFDIYFYCNWLIYILFCIQEHTRYPNCVRFTPDGSKFVSVGADRQVTICVCCGFTFKKCKYETHFAKYYNLTFSILFLIRIRLNKKVNDLCSWSDIFIWWQGGYQN